MELEKFFREQWEKRFLEPMPCEEIEEGCEGKEDGTLIQGFRFADRLIIRIEDYLRISFFKQVEDEEWYPSFQIGVDIFSGETDEIIPKLAESFTYPDDVVIFSQESEIFSGNINIGMVIYKVIKEQERLLGESAKKTQLEEESE